MEERFGRTKPNLHEACGECLSVMLQLVLPGLYLAVAIYAWIDFVRLPKDGLARTSVLCW